MKKALLIVLFLCTTSTAAQAGLISTYPRTGGFKQLPPAHDKWFYVDNERWHIKAPDKWLHMMGSLGAAEFLSTMMDERLAGGIVLGLGVLKEVEDGYREGWSARDLIMDITGVGASLINDRRYLLWCDWEQDAVIMKLSITFD